MDYESNNYFYWFYAGSYSLTISRIVCCWFRFCQPQFASKKMKSVGPSIDSVRTWTFLWRIKVTMLRSLELFRSRMKAPWASTPAFSFRVQHQGRRVGKLCPPARRLSLCLSATEFLMRFAVQYLAQTSSRRLQRIVNCTQESIGIFLLQHADLS